MDRNQMKKDAEKLLQVMKVGYRYTLIKLEEMTHFSSTKLCLALLLLIRSEHIRQFQCEDGVCYVLKKIT
jgi:hypothetical protein